MPELALIPEELPEPSAELVLWRVSMQCFIATVGRRKAERFLTMMARQLSSEENLSSTIPLRPLPQHASVRRAQRQARTVFDRMLPLFTAKLPED